MQLCVQFWKIKFDIEHLDHFEHLDYNVALSWIWMKMNSENSINKLYCIKSIGEIWHIAQTERCFKLCVFLWMEYRWRTEFFWVFWRMRFIKMTSYTSKNVFKLFNYFMEISVLWKVFSENLVDFILGPWDLAVFWE